MGLLDGDVYPPVRTLLIRDFIQCNVILIVRSHKIIKKLYNAYKFIISTIRDNSAARASDFQSLLLHFINHYSFQFLILLLKLFSNKIMYAQISTFKDCLHF